jgi:hypothetical protein
MAAKLCKKTLPPAKTAFETTIIVNELKLRHKLAVDYRTAIIAILATS